MLRCACMPALKSSKPRSRASTACSLEQSAGIDQRQERWKCCSVHSQVLSDPDKRNMYDVYGEEGLRAGMELSTDVRDVRSVYERFQAKQVPCSPVPFHACTPTWPHLLCVDGHIPLAGSQLASTGISCC